MDAVKVEFHVIVPRGTPGHKIRPAAKKWIETGKGPAGWLFKVILWGDRWGKREFSEREWSERLRRLLQGREMDLRSTSR